MVQHTGQTEAWTAEHIVVAEEHIEERRMVEERNPVGLRSPAEGHSLGAYRCRNTARRTSCRVTVDRDAIKPSC